MSEEPSGANTNHLVGTVLMFGFLSVILILQEHYIAGGATALAALIYAGRTRRK